MMLDFERIVRVLREEFMDKPATEQLDEFVLAVNSAGISEALRAAGIGEEANTIACITLKKTELINKLSLSNAITPQQKHDALRAISDKSLSKYADWAIQSAGKNLPELEEDIIYIEGSLGFRITGYRVFKIRGVITMLLHHAFDKVFAYRGSMPLLYFPEGAMYVVPKGMELDIRQITEEVRKEFEALLRNTLTKKESFKAVFGGDLGTRLVTLPDLFEPGKGDDYFDYLLEVLKSSGTKKDVERLEKLSTAAGVTLPKGVMSEVRTICSLLKAFTILVSSTELPEEEQEKLKNDFNIKFRRCFDLQRLKEIGKTLVEKGKEDTEISKFSIKDNLFDTINANKFSAPAYALFLGEPTARVTLKDLGEKQEEKPIGLIPVSERNKLVAHVLGQILKTAKKNSAFNIVNSTAERIFSREVALFDREGALSEFARESLDAYTKSKLRKMADTGVCPLCGSVGIVSEQSFGLFGSGTQSPTNWFRGGLRISGISTRCCKTCLLEAALRTIVLPLDTPSELVIISPLVSKTTLLQEREPPWRIGADSTVRVTLRQTLSMTTSLAKSLDGSGKSPEEICRRLRELLRSPASFESIFSRKEKNSFIKHLKEGNNWKGIEEKYPDRDPVDIVDEVIEGKSSDSNLRKLYDSFLKERERVKAPSHFVGITVPNFFILLHEPFKQGDDSDTEADFRRLISSLAIQVATRHRVLSFEAKWDFVHDMASSDAVTVPRRRKLQTIFGENISPAHAMRALKKAIALELFSFCGDQRIDAVLERASAHESLRGKTLRRMDEKRRMGGKYSKYIAIASDLWD